MMQQPSKSAATIHVVQEATQLVFHCAQCQLPVTQPVRALPEDFRLNTARGEDSIAQGYYTLGDWEQDPAVKDHFILNLSDLVNTQLHRDPKRLNGCCGLDGLDGINTVCSNGHEIGTECSDCWMAHYVHLDPSLVTMDAVS